MPTDDTTHDDVGRDPLAPDDLVAPPEPTEPPRSERPGHRPGELREPARLPETSVRRINHRADEAESSVAGGMHDVTDPQPTMGATLADERRRQGKTLAEVEAATCIRGRLIEHMEKGNYDALPSSAYVKGFIQSYADYLEIPSGPLVAQFKAETAGRDAKAQQHPYITAPLPTATTPRPRRRSRGGAGRRSDLQLPGGRLWIWILALVIVVATAIGIARLLAGGGQEIAPLPNPIVAPSKPTSGSAVTTNPANALPSGSYVVVVKAKANRSSTVQITSAGKRLFAGTLKNGQAKTVTPTTGCAVRLGVPTAVLLTLNGASVRVPDGNGSPVTVRLARP